MLFVVGCNLYLGFVAPLPLATTPQPSWAQPVGAGTEASRAEQQRRHEQERAFENTRRLEAKQDQFLSIYGLGPGPTRFGAL